MKILCTRFPYVSAYGGEEYHTTELACYLAKIHEVSFFGSCKVLTALFSKNSLPTTKAVRVPNPVTPLYLVLFILLLPITVLYIVFHWFIHLRHNSVLYALSLPDKLLITPLFLLSGKRVVWVEHQYLGRWIAGSPLRFSYSFLANYVHIVPISAKNSEVLIHKLHVPKLQLVTIINGVDCEYYAAKEEQATQHNIVYCGRLEAEKGVLVLMNAFSDLLLHHSDAKLTIIGTGSLLNQLQDYVKQHSLESSVFFKQKLTQEALKSEYQAAKVFVLPSLTAHETFGLVAAEALASGTPAIVTEVCGIADTLKAELPHLIVKENSVTALTDALLRELNTERNPAELHSIANRIYNKERMHRQYQELLCTI